MKVETLEESVVSDIGRAFGGYDYGGEHGLIDAFPSRDAAAAFICGYVRMALASGMLHTINETGEAYIAYKRPGEKIGLRAALPLAKALLGAMNLRELIRFIRIMAKGGPGLDKRFDKQKNQGQGYMRRVMKLAFDEGDRLGVPVILETDAKSKCDKYVHLGMELAGTRNFGEAGTLYELIKYPDEARREETRTGEYGNLRRI